MNFDTADADGAACCPICYQQVRREGEFCSEACYNHFNVLTRDEEIVNMNTYIIAFDQEWYHG